MLRKIRVRFAKDFFSIYQLKENLQMEFFYFCEEDKSFIDRCKGKSDVEIWALLKEKYTEYKKNQSDNKD